MTKTMIAPLVAVLALFIKAVFNIEIPDDVQAQTVTIVIGVFALVTTVHGVIKNHKKEGNK